MSALVLRRVEFALVHKPLSALLIISDFRLYLQKGAQAIGQGHLCVHESKDLWNAHN
jgi:hypothetical protein